MPHLRNPVFHPMQLIKTNLDSDFHKASSNKLMCVQVCPSFFFFFELLICAVWYFEADGLRGWKHHHHRHFEPLPRIYLTISRHFSLSFITSGRSSGLHPISSYSFWMYVRAGRPAFARPYVGVHRRTSLMSLSLLLQQCPACLVRLTWIVFVMGGRWPYSWYLVGCCRQNQLQKTLLAEFLCSCRLAFFPAVLLASK